MTKLKRFRFFPHKIRSKVKVEKNPSNTLFHLTLFEIKHYLWLYDPIADLHVTRSTIVHFKSTKSNKSMKVL